MCICTVRLNVTISSSLIVDKEIICLCASMVTAFLLRRGRQIVVWNGLLMKIGLAPTNNEIHLSVRVYTFLGQLCITYFVPKLLYDISEHLKSL